MGEESEPFLLYQGTTKTYQIPIGHLDYKFIEKCTDVKHLEKILRVLRSGEEGCYPELTLFCEKQIESLAPRSRALRREKPPATASDFTAEEWETINAELVSWVTEMNEEDKNPQFLRADTLHEIQDNLPPIRCSSSGLPADQNKKLQNKKTRNKKNIPRGYSEWDKFDVETECSKIDESCEQSNSKARIFNRPRLPIIKKKIDTTGMTKKEKIFIATREKEKGNEAFATGDYVEAVTYYTRSISVIPTAAAYNNKAQAEIKLQDWDSALQDCVKVLEMEPGNIKALMRRATVHSQLQNYQTAREDLNKVLCVEPENALAKKNLLEIEKKLEVLKPVSEIQGKGKKIFIQDMKDSEGDEEREDNTEKHERSSGDKSTGAAAGAEAAAMGNAHRKSHGKGGSKAQGREKQNQKEFAESGPSEKEPQKHLSDQDGEVSGYVQGDGGSESPGAGVCGSPGAGAAWAALPPAAARLKSEGNGLFRSGQFGEAALKYSEAIEHAVGMGAQNPDDLSVLYSNRAACYLKEGNCSDCIQDCNRALELQPFSLKPLLRRAVAQEALERYRQAYVDYRTALQIDSSIQAASDSANRITKTLIDQDGPSWREKLPPIPVVPVALQLHQRDGGNSTEEDNARSARDATRAEELQINWEKAEEQFKVFKTQGNDLVKQSKYEEAVDKYSECMKLNTQECTIYTNRALCYLKLYKYEEAKQDCDRALQIEDANIKAFYRRALAYKGLQNYQASADDFNRVLLMDPNVLEAKKELEEVTQMLELGSSTAAGRHQKQRKKITIQEVTDPEDQEEREGSPEDVLAEHAAQRRGPLQSSEKLHLSEPSTAYDFGQMLHAVNANRDTAACADLLRITDPKNLPVLLSNKLEGEVLLIFIQSLEYYIVGEDPGLVYQHLFYLSKAERFKVVLALLSKNEKEQVQQLFEFLSEKQNNQYSGEDLESLKKVYEL